MAKQGDGENHGGEAAGITDGEADAMAKERTGRSMAHPTGFWKSRFWELIVLCGCLLVLALGISRKEGYHMDELLSFELSNAEFNPWIVPTQPRGRLAKFVENEIKGETFGETLENLKNTAADVLKNRGGSKLLSYQADVYEEPVWIEGEAFHDYITVGKGDAFQYLSVYFNVKDDNHPPFHFMLLHTLSSVFRECAEPFVGCLINLGAIAGILLLLMKTGRRLACAFGMQEQARRAGIFAALCFGLSTGAMASVLLVRMYAVLAFFGMALFAIHVDKWLDGSFGKKNKLLIAVTVLGFWTQYFFLFYCLILAAVTGALLFAGKRKKEFWIYVRSMVSAGVIGVLVFPFAVSDVFSSGRGVEALGNLSEGLHGFGSRLAAFSGIVSTRTFGTALTIAALAAMAALGLWLWKSCRERFALFLMLAAPAAGYFLLAARMSPYLVDRYMMMVFPFVVLMGALSLLWISMEVGRRIGLRQAVDIMCILVAVFLIYGLTQYDGSYLYRGYARQRQMSEEYASLPCICVYEGVGYYENLLEFENYEKTLLLKPGELENRKDRASIAELDQVVLLIKPGVDVEQTLDRMEQDYGLKEQMRLWRESVYGDVAIVLGR